MTQVDEVQLFRLQRAHERLKKEYESKAPSIIIKVELLLIKEICDNLLTVLK